MLSRPTTDRVIAGAAQSLEDDVLPTITDEPARVAVQMILQLLKGAAVRSAHEIAWMLDEIAEIRDVAGPFAGEPAVAAAHRELDALDTTGLHLADVQARYDRAGEVLSCAVEAAFAAGDQQAVARLRDVLARRSEHEMAIVGQLDLVGRG